jgi:hypothetical protein
LAILAVLADVELWLDLSIIGRSGAVAQWRSGAVAFQIDMEASKWTDVNVMAAITGKGLT